MTYLLVQNPGVAPVEGFTLLGVSTTRDCGVEGAIGQFGSGNKHAINVLLRAGLKVVVYCGKTRLDFQTRDDEIDDGLIRKPVKRVMCKMGGTSTRTIDLGWVLDFGAIDWTDLGMALREFVSNAIDRTVREENGEFVPAILDERLLVGSVGDEKLKAKDGYTRVYVEMNAEVQRYLDQLPRRFLHFSADPSQVKRSFLPKDGRNLHGTKTAVIYRAGVYVREIEESVDESVYDYNFKTHELQIDECRNSSDYTIKVAIAKLYRSASVTELISVFDALANAKPVFEARLDPYYICPSYDTPKEEHKKNWQQAWQAVAADAVMCGPSPTIAEFVGRKGHAVRTLQAASFVNAAAQFGITTEHKVLTGNEKNGFEKMRPTEAAQAALDEVWGWLTQYNFTANVEKPAVGCFRSLMDAGSRTLGFCDETAIYVADDQASARGKPLLKTVLEECIHWITKAGDNSRDLQDCAFRLIVEILA